MSDEKPHELLIIKRVRGHDGGGHGGAWKIAFADFMTAMMALFLVLWLISATNEKTKASLARYFNPVKLVDMTVQKRGLSDPTERSPEDASDNGQDSKTSGNQKGSSKNPAPKAHGKAAKSPKGAKQPQDAGGAADFQPTYSETALFRDPYAVLAEIAAVGPAVNPSDKVEHPNVGAAASFQDPFQTAAPVVPQQVAPQAALQAASGQPADNDASASRVAAAPESQTVTPTAAPAQPAADQASDKSVDRASPAAAEAAQKTVTPSPAKSESAKAEQTKSEGAKSEAAKSESAKSEQAKSEQAKSDAAKSDAAKSAQAKSEGAKSEAAKNEAAQAAKDQPKEPPAEQVQALRLQSEIAGALGKAAVVPNIQVKPTEKGIVISLTDGIKYAMFAIGSAEPQPRTVQIMQKIAQILKKEKGAIVISGHTDGRRYKSRTYDNWRLSEARAQMALYMLVRGGLDEKRVIKIEGAADHELKVPNDPMAAENRRIEILLRKSTS